MGLNTREAPQCIIHHQEINVLTYSFCLTTSVCIHSIHSFIYWSPSRISHPSNALYITIYILQRIHLLLPPLPLWPRHLFIPSNQPDTWILYLPPTLPLPPHARILVNQPTHPSSSDISCLSHFTPSSSLSYSWRSSRILHPFFPERHSFLIPFSLDILQPCSIPPSSFPSLPDYTSFLHPPSLPPTSSYILFPSAVILRTAWRNNY